MKSVRKEHPPTLYFLEHPRPSFLFCFLERLSTAQMLRVDSLVCKRTGSWPGFIAVLCPTHQQLQPPCVTPDWLEGLRVLRLSAQL